MVVEGDVAMQLDTGDAPAHQLDALTRLAILVTVALAGLHLQLFGGVPIALVVVLLLTPMWWHTLRHVEFSGVIIWLTVAALVAGLYLAQSAAEDHDISQSGQRLYAILLLGGIAVMLAVLWARAYFPLHVVAVAYGLGDLANALLFTSGSWKYFLALPVTIVVVGWLGKYSRQSPAVLALLALGVLTALDRGRSYFAFCVLAACVVMWQAHSRTGSRTARWTPAVLLAAAAAATYNLAVGLLTNGYLGEAARERTVTQIETSGSLLLGGRPQWAATAALMQERPWGYGLGVIPNSHDYALVASAFRSLNVDEDGYIRNSMLLGQFRLHSITADLWVRCGLIGLALAILMGFVVVRSLSGLIGERRCPPIVALMAILAMWYLAFEPTYSYSRDVFFALGVTLMFRPADRGQLTASTTLR